MLFTGLGRSILGKTVPSVSRTTLILAWLLKMMPSFRQSVLQNIIFFSFFTLALQIRCQLNFVRGNIANNPDSHRFIPAFFTCNGGKKDIPDFLSHRWSYKLPKELDRVIFRVLNVEKIQPHRFQPIVVMGGNGHPFDEKKKELEKAVQEADSFHKNNLQV